MAISINKYVSITSGVGAGAVVPNRELIARVFTVNPILPPDEFLEFTSASEVADYFGSTSEEYKRALFYFGFVSKNKTRPQKISFARWTDENVAPRIYGARIDTTFSEFAAITDGSFTMQIGAQQNTFTGIDFTGVVSLAAVAAILQTEIRTGTGGTQWSAATVTYDAVRGGFNFVGGDAAAVEISVTEGVAGTPIAGTIGWLEGAILAKGALLETVTETLTQSAEDSDNFGSFVFIPALTNEEIVEAAEWNKAENVKYQYHIPVTLSGYSALEALIADIGGCGATISVTTDEYPEMLPTMVLAATDYTQPNSVQNYMYQQATLTPSVTTDIVSDALDEKRINYYGRTQESGQTIDFYQRGYLMGLATDPRDMNTYANEQWLKSAATALIMTLFLSLPKISANTRGINQVLAALQSIINQALLNGTISVGKTLSVTQQLYVTEVTGDPNAWYQVQTNGYWVGASIVEEGDEKVLKYVLIYSKDDIIRKVDGTHVLI